MWIFPPGRMGCRCLQELLYTIWSINRSKPAWYGAGGRLPGCQWARDACRTSGAGFKLWTEEEAPRSGDAPCGRAGPRNKPSISITAIRSERETIMKTSARMEALKPHFFCRPERAHRSVKAQGREIIRLDEGSPDLPPAPHIIEALHRSAQLPDSAQLSAAPRSTSPPPGLDGLVCRSLLREYRSGN